MFRRLFVTRVGLPREVWEPLRVLHFEQGIPVEVLAKAFNISLYDMGRVLLVAHVANYDASVKNVVRNEGACLDMPQGLGIYPRRSRDATTAS